MRYPADQAERTRERLVELAADTLRTRGVAGVGVQSLMRAAGLTHGGFYAHFRSRDALLAAAVARMFEHAAPATCDADPRTRLARFIAGYLSEAHVAAPERGCPLPTLAGEMARLPDAALAPYRAGRDRLRARLSALLEDAGCDVPADVVLAQLVGGVALARLEQNADTRRRLLADVSGSLTTQLGLTSAS